ncbi:MAG: hypothetical protein WCT32_00615 [Patescibacteria group bacterium]
MTWCLESAIILINDALNDASRKLTGRSVVDLLREAAGISGATSKDASRMAYELKRHQYIEIGEGSSVRLTNKAKIRIIDKISQSREWDNLYRVISFDIPETKKSKRDSFRRAIKRMGFVQVQKSLWVGKRNVGDLIDLVSDEYQVSDYVAYFVADRTNINAYLQRLLEAES